MPYKEGGKWRGVVKIGGKRIAQKSGFLRKKHAAAWERKEKKKEKKLQGGMDLMTFCTKYLDHATQFTPQVYKEKMSLTRRIMIAWGTDIPAQDVTPEMILSYISNRKKYHPEDKSAKKKKKNPLVNSNNSFNRDRKNLFAMWTWGQDILGFPVNPVSKIKKRSHNRSPQYTPPTQDILRILAVATREEKVFLDCYLLTGARRSEVLRWTWVDDINFEQRQCRLGTRKTKDGSMEYEWFSMIDELYESLWWLWNNRKDKHSPFVFPHYYYPNDAGYNWKGEQRANRWLKDLCKRANVQFFGFHALRRYVASYLADTHKVSAKRVQLILRHKQLSTTERYIKVLNQDIKETLNLLSKKLVPESVPEKKQGVSRDDD